MVLLGTMRVKLPSKSNPWLPSFASIRDENFPPSRKSTVLRVVCQSSCAAFHCLMSSGLLQAFHTRSSGALTKLSTVIFWVVFMTFLTPYSLVERRRPGSTALDRRGEYAPATPLTGSDLC